MNKFRLPCSAQPEIVIGEIGGELNLKGQEQNEVIVKVTGELEPELEATDNHIKIGCEDDCTIYVPHGALVMIENVGSNASVKSLGGKLKIGQIGRELVLRDVGQVEVAQIGLDLSAKRVRGDLVVDSVGRGAIIRDVDGQFKAGSIGQHLNLRDVSGGVTVATGGHADLNLAPVPWQTYSVSAGGNISFRLVEEASAELKLRAGGRIRISLPEFSETIREKTYHLTVGEGGPQVELAAGGNLDVSGQRAGWETYSTFTPDMVVDVEEFDRMAEDIEQQVTSQIGAMTEHLDSFMANLEGSFDTLNMSEEKRQRVREKMEQARGRLDERTRNASERARERAEKARARVEIRLEEARRRAEQAPRPPRPPQQPREIRFTWPMSGGASAKPQEPAEVSEEERLMILRMLADKKISTAEANRLLAALEGSEE